jgi:hypothetical protein
MSNCKANINDLYNKSNDTAADINNLKSMNLLHLLHLLSLAGVATSLILYYKLFKRYK